MVVVAFGVYQRARARYLKDIRAVRGSLAPRGRMFWVTVCDRHANIHLG